MTLIWPLPPLDYPDYDSEGWLLDEDRAVRDLMKGMVVSDQENQARRVEAWFGHPDQELREQKYPYVTVNLINIQEGLDRVHRGDLYIKDPPKWWGLDPLKPWQVGYLLEMPTPVDLDYQISTWARNPRHDRQILNQLYTGGRIMFRGGLLYTADRKIRRLDFMGQAKRDTVEDGKRLFNNIFRIRVSSEVPWGIIGNHGLPGSGPGSGSIGGAYGEVTSIYLDYKAKFRDLGLIPEEHMRIVAATILVFDADTHHANLVYNGSTISGVPVVSYLRGLGVGDTVAVSVRGTAPLANVTNQHLLVVGLEKKADQ
jgi:hypothetical protein